MAASLLLLGGVEQVFEEGHCGRERLRAAAGHGKEKIGRGWAGRGSGWLVGRLEGVGKAKGRVVAGGRGGLGAAAPSARAESATTRSLEGRRKRIWAPGSEISSSMAAYAHGCRESCDERAREGPSRRQGSSEGIQQKRTMTGFLITVF